MIEYRDTIDNFYQLYDTSWSGAKDNLNIVIKYDLENYFYDYLITWLQDTSEILTRTEINDLIWFEDESLMQDFFVCAYQDKKISAEQLKEIINYYHFIEEEIKNYYEIEF